MTDLVKAWQCIGCGRIEAPQTCVGVCRDRRVEFVYASEHDEISRQLAAARATIGMLEMIARQLAHTTPRAGAWEGSYRAFQQRARKALEAIHAAP